ncbi:MAG: sterol desaturase family protein [Flavobacteriales bacterium]|nr:sterol desaturase family protein [Flavobacteriales bacterium]
MPTLLQLLTDPVSIMVHLIYGGLILCESLFPARVLPPVKGWKWKGLLAFAGYFLLSSYLPYLWTEQLASWQLVDLSGLGIAAGTVVGLLVYELGVYLWHRAMHASDLLWRTFHQMHHSAERLDTFGAYWFSPMDTLGWTVVNSLCLTLLVGIDPQATVYVIYITTFLGVFQHSNIRTPHWLGYLVQRPESHSRHHERGVHSGNYTDLPLMDMLFGTFHNPKDFARETGFRPGDSGRLREMLTFKDISIDDRPGIGPWLEDGITADELVRKRA